MKSMQFRRSITIILGALFAIILMYLWYTQFYIRSREKQLIETHYRVLDQVGENLKARIFSYIKNARNLQQAMEENDREIYSLNLKKNQFEKLKGNDAAAGPSFIDSLNSYDEKIKIRTEFYNNYTKVYNADFKDIKHMDKMTGDSVFVSKDSLVIAIKDYWFFVPLEFLLKNIDRKDIFEKSMILDTSSIIYSSFARDIRLDFMKSENAGKNQNEGFFNISPEITTDTLYLPGGGSKKAATIHGSRSYNITLSDGNFKLFLKPVRIENLNWFIGGLVNQKDFQRSVRSIAPGFIIILSIVLLLVMVSLPFVKLKVMSKTEMLGTGTVVYAGLAFFLGASFLILFLFFKAYNLSNLKETDEKLVALSDTISRSLRTELESVYRQLDATDSLFISDQGSTDLKKNEYYIANIFNEDNIWKPAAYKYFDYIFWLDSTGQALAQISPFSFQEKLFKYSDRDYFKKYDEWFWPYANSGKIKKFRMESFVSATSGEFKTAISRPSADGNHVIVMTGRFFSLIDPILPVGYKFCIIDETGKVWFHSNKYQNLGENFLSECNNDRQLAAALYANVSKSLSVSYYNNYHRINFTRLSGLPLYLVTMYDLQMEYSYQAQVFITTVILISFLFIYMLVLLIIILVMKHLLYKDLIAVKFELDIINFRKSKKNDYVQLIVMFSVALIIYCALMPWMPDMLAIITIYNIVVVLFVILFIHLYDFPGKSFAVHIFKSINALIMVALFLLLHYLAGNFAGNDQGIFYYSLIPLILSLIIIYRYKKNDPLYMLLMKWSLIRKLIHNIDRPEMAYSLLIFLMIILFGVAPILKFFDISADLENNIHTRFGQYELASDKEKRNLAFEEYYERIKDCTENEYCYDIYTRRKDEGIFSGFWNRTRWERLSEQGDKTKYTEDFESLVNAFRPLYKDQFSVYSKYLLYDTIENRPFKWINAKNDIVLVYDSPTEDLYKNTLTKIAITSHVPKANIFKPIWKPGKYGHSPEVNHFGFIKIAIVYAILILLLYLLYRLIIFTTKNAFGSSLIEDYTVSNFNGRLTDHMRDNIPVIVVNPSSFLGFKELEDKISGKFKTKEFDWANPRQNDFSKSLLVKDLFMEFQDSAVLKDKLDRIKECMQVSGKLIFLMEMSPDLVVNFYKEKLESINKPDPKAEKVKDDKTEIISRTSEALNDFLKRVIVLYVPVCYNADDNDPVRIQESLISKEEETKDFKTLIDLDLSGGDYLLTLKIPMYEHLKTIEDRAKDKGDLVKFKKVLITRISEMAGKYYRNLLDNCPVDEKIVLLDLALDSIANVKNKEAIIKLLRKGLITKGEDSIELMNCSFRAFLLSHYTKHDKEEYRKSIGIRSGNWAGYKYALWLVIAALFIFIFISNQEFLQNLNKMFIALGASIGGITTLLGIMGKKVRES